jgi:UDP-N-acetylmuramoyl-tripeptide--D-alanyl-D-alanine ligase
MSDRALWTSAEITAATNGRAGKRFAADGVSIDSRKVERGDLFVALHGPNFDGNDFAAGALGAGAAGALVDREPPAGAAADMPVVVVKDTLEALHALGAAARARSEARIAAVTGSVGKTSTKEALKAALGAFGRTFASQGNLNNHWGVPLSLARMPRDAEFGVFELGMNHANEIMPLSKLVRPAVSIITNVEAVHIEFFKSVAEIADAKAEIMDGMDAGAAMVLPRDNPHYDRLVAHAQRRDLPTLSFGTDEKADARLIDCQVAPNGSRVIAEILGQKVSYALGLPGLHQAKNSLAVLAAIAAFGLDVGQAVAALADLKPLKGRGAREQLQLADGVITLLDESYNASPASVRAALSLLAGAEPEGRGRRIAVLGDMRELGEQGPALHRELAPDLAAAGVELAFLIGPLMRGLNDLLPQNMRGGHWGDSESAAAPVRDALKGGDVVLVKGSLGTRMAPIVAALRAADAGTMRRPKAANGD